MHGVDCADRRDSEIVGGFLKFGHILAADDT
jgi:hypothetical protein